MCAEYLENVSCVRRHGSSGNAGLYYTRSVSSTLENGGYRGAKFRYMPVNLTGKLCAQETAITARGKCVARFAFWSSALKPRREEIPDIVIFP